MIGTPTQNVSPIFSRIIEKVKTNWNSCIGFLGIK
jgi:hypothetical protein